MYLFVRLALFILITLLVLYGAVEIAFILLGFVSVWYRAYEFMFVGFCIDCYFAPEAYTFWYTFMMSAIVIGGIFLQPFIRTYRDI